MSILCHLSWSKLPPFVVEATTFRGRSYHLSWSKLPPFVVEATTFHGRSYHLSWSKLPPFVVEATTFHGRSYHLSWSRLPPLAPERPINTGGSRLRNQVIYQEHYQGVIKSSSSRENSALQPPPKWHFMVKATTFEERSIHL